MSDIMVNLMPNDKPYSIHDYSREAKCFGELNVKAIKEFNPYNNHEKSVDLNIPLKNIDDIIYFDINYIYKNILMRVGNISKSYLLKISNEVKGEIIEEKVNVKYNEHNEKTYIKTNVYVTKNIIEYILANYSSWNNILRRDFEWYIEYMFDKKYCNGETYVGFDEFRLEENAKRYINHVYLVSELNSILGKSINRFDFDRMMVHPQDIEMQLVDIWGVRYE